AYTACLFCGRDGMRTSVTVLASWRAGRRRRPMAGGSGASRGGRALRWVAPPHPAPLGGGPPLFSLCSPVLVHTRSGLPSSLQQGAIGASHAPYTALGKVSSA